MCGWREVGNKVERGVSSNKWPSFTFQMDIYPDGYNRHPTYLCVCLCVCVCAHMCLCVSG